jgi:hypothetical protein
MAPRPAHRRGTYTAKAAQVRAQANANPMTRCWRCGRTLDQHGPGNTWDAGHIRSGDPTSPLAAEASSCNRSAGAALGNRQRSGLRTTREW